MKFRKRPVVIEASQWFKLGDHPDVSRHSLPPIEDGKGWIDTLEGGHVVTPGDWIITGVQGEHYPCKPDIFAATYENAADLQARDLKLADLARALPHGPNCARTHNPLKSPSRCNCPRGELLAALGETK